MEPPAIFRSASNVAAWMAGTSPAMTMRVESVRNYVHIPLMRTTSYSDLRKNLAATLDRLTEDHEPVVITRDKGKPAAVLISLEDFASYEETSYLLQSPRNAERLRAAIDELDAGCGKERKLAE
jgi:antitoxin YefM